MFGVIATGPRWSNKKAAEELKLKKLVWKLMEAQCHAGEKRIALERQLNSERDAIVMLEVGLEAAYTKLCGISNEADKLKAESKIAESIGKRKETRDVINDIAKLNVVLGELELSVAQLTENALPIAKLRDSHCKRDLEQAKLDLQKVKLQNLVLLLESPFAEYPIGQSIPPMLHLPPHLFCPCCPNA